MVDARHPEQLVLPNARLDSVIQVPPPLGAEPQACPWITIA
jgi:hypothetical protein